MTRKEYNLEIFEELKNRKFFNSFLTDEMTNEVHDVLMECINDFPEQRFGQIFTNYVYPDYRNRSDETLNHIMDMLFYGVEMDPFFEESSESHKRLVGIFENWKLKLRDW